HSTDKNISNGSPLFNNSSKFFGQTPPSTSPSSIQLPINELSKHSIKEPIKITVKITLLDSIEVQWESVRHDTFVQLYRLRSVATRSSSNTGKWIR
ncbi:ornithine decarboxylase antizyme-like protein, partial [Euroglyphus maynei]